MIRQRVGDLLEVKQGRRYFYVVVLTGVVQFGGNVVFAFHNDGRRRRADALSAGDPGFMICTDLVGPKRDGRVERLLTLGDVSGFRRTDLVKSTPVWRAGVKATVWFVHKLDRPGGVGVECRGELSREFREAMDDGCHSFDLVAEKVMARYSPDQNEHL